MAEIQKLDEKIESSFKKAYHSLTWDEKKSLKKEIIAAISTAGMAVGSEIQHITRPYYAMISTPYQVAEHEVKVFEQYIPSEDIMTFALLAALALELGLATPTIKKFVRRFREHHRMAKQQSKAKLSRVI